MKAQMIGMLIQLLTSALTPDLLKKFADMALDFVENQVAGTASEVDDAIVLPICDLIRSTFDIPDND